MFAAIACATANPSCRVDVLEHARQFLGKVKVSGGGRCNLTHACFDPAELVKGYPRGGRELLGPFTRFQPHDTIAWFAARGVETKTESDGRIFPTTDRSETVVDCLLQSARVAGVHLRESTRIIDLKCDDAGHFVVSHEGGEMPPCDRVLLATGGNKQGHALARALGHTIIPPVASLFTFAITDPRIAGLAGVSVQDAAVELDGVAPQRGPVLVTHWGLSGPAVIKLSAWAARALFTAQYRSELRISWLPDMTAQSVLEKFVEYKHTIGGQYVWRTPFHQIPQRLWQRLVEAADILDGQRWSKLPRGNMLKLAAELCDGRYEISGKGVFKDEFVTAGGVALNEIDWRTMQSKGCPGLYFAGEVLDIDGITGGYNFQSAWTTGWIAGNAMANQVPN